MATERRKTRLQVSRWGNSLAVRISAESAKALRIREGDTVAASIAPNGSLVLTPERKAPNEAARRLRRFVSRQREGTPVVADMRRNARH